MLLKIVCRDVLITGFKAGLSESWIWRIGWRAEPIKLLISGWTIDTTADWAASDNWLVLTVGVCLLTLSFFSFNEAEYANAIKLKNNIILNIFVLCFNLRFECLKIETLR